MQASTGYIDQDPHELRLALIEGQTTHGLTIYARQVCELAGTRVDASIIGASHFITFTRGDRQFSEMLACAQLPQILDTRSLGALLAEGTLRRRWEGGVQYEFSCQELAWVDPEPSDLVTLVGLARDAGSRAGLGLVQEFPAGQLDVTPKTVIYGAAHPDGSLVIETAHSYPNVRSLILSRTTISYT